LQLPHWSVPPQPSPAGPHWIPCCAHVSGVQTGPPAPQRKGLPPPPQVPPTQPPQSIVPPQPSPAGPHWIPCCAHVSGTQVGPPLLLPVLVPLPPPVHWPATQAAPGKQAFPQAPQLLGSLAGFTHPLAHITVPAGQGEVHTLPLHTLGGGQVAGVQAPATLQLPFGSQEAPVAQAPPGQQG
jgi:hypothetical protein